MDKILCVEVNEDIEIKKTRYYFRNILDTYLVKLR